MQSHPHHGGVLGAETPVSVHTQCFGALARGIGAVATAAQRLLSQHARTRRFGQLGERFGQLGECVLLTIITSSTSLPIRSCHSTAT
jgi:hypothetical protein